MAGIFGILSPKPRDIFDPPSFYERVYNRPLQYLIGLLFRFFNRLQSVPRPQKPLLRVVCISDTHNIIQQIPEGDILIHAGDLTDKGTIPEIQAQIDWLDSLPHSYKFAIAGNHDAWFDPQSRRTLSTEDQTGSLNWKSVRYLQHSSADIVFKGRTEESRKIRIYGAPQIPACGGSSFAFQYSRGRDAWTETIPENVNILVTHTPPKYHLDLFSPSLGCEFLLKSIWVTKPQLHVFGHVHAGAGRETVRWDAAQAIYEQVMDRKGIFGFFNQVLSPRLWIAMLRLVFHGFTGIVWSKIWGGEQHCTTMINAALMLNNGGTLGNPVQVVDI
jgi:Icc-related predicted phosphoesterase